MAKQEPGFCVYLFTHAGIGRIVEETQNMAITEQKLNEPGSDALYVVCDSDKKTAIKKYNDLKSKSSKTNKKKSSRNNKNKSNSKKAMPKSTKKAKTRTNNNNKKSSKWYKFW